MRTKFRAWDSRENVMLSPEDVEHGNYALGSHGLMVAHEKDSEHLWNVDHFLTPLFWTGLTDRNGKEIYEGDILKHWWSRRTKDIVHYENGGFKAGIYRLGETTDDREVIGNQFQNPELINS